MAMISFCGAMLPSGFMFPFAGKPWWAQLIGNSCPLTHYLRIVRAIMLKGQTLVNLKRRNRLTGLMLLAMLIAVTLP
jgi:ABC-2 type transport system permease protein